ncbi:MAG: methylenetetrahydrofolate reductase C-terminal domain-containing protein [Candidatus Omnitrophota bacterium]
MIATKQKPQDEILRMCGPYKKIFLVGCGDCATTCKTGGEEEIKKMKEFLEKEGYTVTGFIIPKAPCVAAQLKIEMAKNKNALKESEAMLILACGSGVQSVKENDRLELFVLPGCDTLFGAIVDSQGIFREKCSACGECVLEITGGICPVTLCSKGLLNGPCGGQNKGKCEVDKERDCAWVLIFKELEKKGKAELMLKIKPPKDYSKMVKPRSLSAEVIKNA